MHKLEIIDSFQCLVEIKSVLWQNLQTNINVGGQEGA